MTRPEDWRERAEALDPARSFIVQAPAGSGKTELLIQRILRLLAQVAQPEEVLAITFTRKAAAEMANRLFAELQDAYDEQGETPSEAHKQLSRELALKALANDSARGWDLLQQPSRLRIKTIDSLCSDLARQLPVYSGLGRGFAIATRPEARYLEAVDRALSAVEDENDSLCGDIIRVLLRYDNQYDRVCELLVTMLGNRDQWLPHLLALRTGRDFDRPALEQALEVLLTVSLEELQALIPGELMSALPRFFAFALENEPSDSEALQALMQATCNGAELEMESTSAALPHWKTLANRLITKNGQNWRKTVSKNDGFPAPSSARGEEAALYQAMKKEFLALLDCYRDDDKLREALHAMMSLPEPHYSDEDWADLESLLRILLRAVEEWQLVSARSAEVDFIEVASRARLALGAEQAPSDLALRLDHRIQHVLVDEFQDTSSGQISLLERLTEGWTHGDGRTMFLVGDPMQSIYRFRKAEVSLYIRTWQGELFDHIGLEALRLSVNFRSGQPLVDWVNLVFPRVMPAHNDAVMGAVHYSAASARPQASSRGHISVHIGLDEDELTEAQHIVQWIDQAGNDESVAILVRSRNHARAILTLLDQLKDSDPRYRYRAIEFFRLNESPLVLDLVSLTLAIIQPADRLAWLALLRAPFCGLSLAELEILTDGQADRLIADQLSTFAKGPGRPAGLQADTLCRLNRISLQLLQALDQYQRKPLREIVEHAWLKLGGPATMRHADEMRDAETYFDLLSSLQDERLDIDRETLDTRLEHLYASPDSAAGVRISVMTIYAAKGLEFDRVIVPGLNRSTSGDKGQLIHWFELAGTELIAVSPMRNEKDKQRRRDEGDLIEFISQTERKRQSYELGRLLYVAATRARSHLHLCSSLNPRADGSISARGNSMLGLLWPAVEQEHLPGLMAAAAALDGQVSSHPDRPIPQIQRRLDARWALPGAPRAVSMPEPEALGLQQYIEFSWAGEDARISGSLVHRILQWMSQSEKSAADFPALEPGISRWCKAVLSRCGIHGEKAETLSAEINQAVGNCLDSETGRWILEKHEQSESELAITAIVDGKVRNLVLDRTFVDQGVRWIIDFKTSRHSGGNLDGFLKQESERYAEQLSTYRNAIALTETRPIRTALYYPVFDRLLEVEPADRT